MKSGKSLSGDNEKTRKIVLYLCLCLYLSGCATEEKINYWTMPAEQLAGYVKIKIKTTEFDNYVDYTMPELQIQFSERPLFPNPSIHYIKPDSEMKSTGASDQSFLIRGSRDKTTGKMTHQLYVTIQYCDVNYVVWGLIPTDFGKRRFYRTASFKGGKVVDLMNINTEIIFPFPLVFKEIVGIWLTEDFLREYSESGLTVRLNAQSGDQTFITVPPNYIQAYLKVISSK